MTKWKPIRGFEDCYEVSDIGDVRRVVTHFGNPTCRPCKPTWSKGYARFVLSINGTKRTFSAHRAVWEAFCGPIPQGMQINHRNGNKADNSISNLELCTSSENRAHAYRVLGVAPNINPNHGIKNGRAKLKSEHIPEIKRLYNSGLTQNEIADRYGVCQKTISRIVNGKGWLAY